MSNTKLDPNPFKQALKDRENGVLLCQATVDRLLQMGAELHDVAKDLAALKPELEQLQADIENELGGYIDNVENQA